MDQREFRILRNILFLLAGAITIAVISACSVQWAIKNKNTDCGFTNDRIMPQGQKDPMIFYGTPKSSGK